MPRGKKGCAKKHTGDMDEYHHRIKEAMTEAKNRTEVPSKPASPPASSTPIPTTPSKEQNLFRVEVVDERKGRGIVATQPVPAGTTVVRRRPRICVLYDDYARTHCALCFTRVESALSTGCNRCKLFQLCRACGGIAVGTSLREEHDHVCSWLTHLGVDLSGDTDYIRFILSCGARVVQGDVSLLVAIGELIGSDEGFYDVTFKKFCESFARRVVQGLQGVGYPIALESLVRILLKVKVNAIGFPVVDGELAGWAVDEVIAMANHSCSPNCTVEVSSGGFMVLTTTEAVQSGAEMTISYIGDGGEVRERCRQLLSAYRFMCTCARCACERAAAKSAAS